MKSEIKIEKTVTLKLTEEETSWLKNVVRDPIRGNHREESPGEYVMRTKFWDALNVAPKD